MTPTDPLKEALAWADGFEAHNLGVDGPMRRTFKTLAAAVRSRDEEIVVLHAETVRLQDEGAIIRGKLMGSEKALRQSEAELGEVKSGREWLQGMFDSMVMARDSQKARAEAAEAKVARLAGALKTHEHWTNDGSDHPEYNPNCECCVALRETEGPAVPVTPERKP